MGAAQAIRWQRIYKIDAPINKGNSGGPAFNVNGNVIGVNTAIFSPSGGSVGIGFDIPAETAKMVVAQLKEHGYVNRAWLGVQIRPVTADIADSLGLKKAEGAMVDQPQPGSPAAKAGIASGDVISLNIRIHIATVYYLSQKFDLVVLQRIIHVDVPRFRAPIGAVVRSRTTSASFLCSSARSENL